MHARACRGTALLFALALAALLFEGGTLPHVHDEPGWHNHEHDLGYLVVLAAAGVPAAIAAAPVYLDVRRDAPRPVTRRTRVAIWRHRAPRAPPTR
jgi:hypothetical protein